jgi:hypothetical protein
MSDGEEQRTGTEKEPILLDYGTAKTVPRRRWTIAELTIAWTVIHGLLMFVAAGIGSSGGESEGPFFVAVATVMASPLLLPAMESGTALSHRMPVLVVLILAAANSALWGFAIAMLVRWRQR